MKIHTPLLFTALLATASFAQGPLTPPGPPEPTMKTLDQIEARTIVNAANTPGDATNTFIITAPGSYYLTGNLIGEAGKHGISIQASDVRLDLNGFSLLNTEPGAVRGIDVPAEQKNLAIRSGSIRGWGDGGVRAENVRGVLAEKLHLSDNTDAPGLSVGLGALVIDCVANANGIGFRTPDRCELRSCISTENTANGFECGSYVTLLDCTSSRNQGTGIVTGGGATLVRCSSTRNLPGGRGFSVGESSNLSHCNATQNGSDGIWTDGRCTISACVAGSNGDSGIASNGPGSAITDCTTSNNVDFGIYNYDGTVVNSTATANGTSGIVVGSGTVSGSAAKYNLTDGIVGDNVSHCTAGYNGQTGISSIAGVVTACDAENNGQHGIFANDGRVADCRVAGNGAYGIFAAGAVISGCLAELNISSGISGNFSTITHCQAKWNGNHGIEAQDGVLAFSMASGNNQNANGSVNFYTPPGGPGTTRLGNNPTP